MAPPTSVGGQSTPSTSSPCFGADDGGLNGILYSAVRSYDSQDCANNENCDIGRQYGWPMNSWCVGNVTDLSSLFSDMSTFNEDINGWNTSSVILMERMFWNATSFNRDLSNFDTSSVTGMSYMFWGATLFNGDVSSFDTSSVIGMYAMFWGASSFNRDVSNFDTSKVVNLREMFYNARSFNQDLCLWQDSFPYTAYIDNIFTNSGCTYKYTPQEDERGPFCASDCGSLQVVS